MTPARPETKRTGGIFAARSLAGRLHLAAAPVFALMALATALDTGPMATMCGGGVGGWPLGGMTPMYILMAAFHLPPWLEMVSGGHSEPRCR